MDRPGLEHVWQWAVDSVKGIHRKEKIYHKERKERKVKKRGRVLSVFTGTRGAAR
ncbi:MAG: hypothetical protein Fur0021_25750 [Candidatus Promineifilaceae bacterium]